VPWRYEARALLLSAFCLIISTASASHGSLTLATARQRHVAGDRSNVEPVGPGLAPNPAEMPPKVAQ
jgi:hypothetical protein